MADITVTTDFSQVNELNAAIDRTSVVFAKTVATIVREQKSMERAIKASAAVQEEATSRLSSKMSKDTQDWLQAQRRKLSMMAESDKMAQKQAASEAKLTTELARQRIEAEKAGSVRSPVQQRIEGATGVSGRSSTSAAGSAAAMEAEIERLRMKYDKIYASANLYEKSLNELSRAHMLGVTSAKQHEAAVESLNLEYQNFQNGTAQAGNRFTQHMNQTSSGMNNLGVAAQQTGYQFSDFIVQVQGGTNPLVAFSQQATQLAGLLYLLPPALQNASRTIAGFTVTLSMAFAGITILIPLLSMLAMAFYNSAKEAKDAADGPMKDAEERIKSLDSTLKEFLITRKAAAMGVTVDELISLDSLDAAKTALNDADKALKKIQDRVSNPVLSGQGVVTGAIVATADYFGMSDAEESLAAAQEKRAEAALRLNQVEARIAGVYKEQRNELIQNYDLEVARLKLGEDSFQFKQLQADADKRSYEEQLRANGELNAQAIAGLMAIYAAQQESLKARQSELVVTQNQRAADDARGKERLAAEQEYQAAIDRTVAKNQYWSEQAKAAERQRVAVEYIVNNLSLLGAKKDAEGFNKAMEDALAAGVQFSLVDLSSIVRIAASNGWDLAAAIQAAYSAATQKAPAAASVLVGAGGRPDVGIDRKAIAGAEALMVEKRRKEAEAAAKGGGSDKEPTESMLEKFQKQLDLEKELLNTTETYQRVRSALGEEFEATSPKVIEGLMQQATEIENLTRLEEDRQSLMDSVNGSLETGFMAMVKGTQTVEEAFRTMAAAIIEELFRVLVVKKLVEGVTNVISGAFGGGAGGFTNTQAGRLTGGGRASGGSMMSGQPYLVGEQGPEIVIPRHSGTVLNANQTSGAMAGSGGITVQNNITVTGSDAAMVRQEVAKMIPQITNATKAAVIDAKQRGGAMAAAFR